MKETLVESPKSHKPRYWLEYGCLDKKSGANPYATVHTPSQALATQLPEQRNMQGLAGYASVKTTEIYPPIFPQYSGSPAREAIRSKVPCTTWTPAIREIGGVGCILSGYASA
jgi:hypothetical protein